MIYHDALFPRLLPAVTVTDAVTHDTETRDPALGNVTVTRPAGSESYSTRSSSSESRSPPATGRDSTPPAIPLSEGQITWPGPTACTSRLFT